MSKIDSAISAPSAAATVLVLAPALAFWVTAAAAASLGPLDSGDAAPPPTARPGAAAASDAPASGSLFDDSPVLSTAPISSRVIAPIGDGLDLGPLIGKPLARGN